MEVTFHLQYKDFRQFEIFVQNRKGSASTRVVLMKIIAGMILLFSFIVFTSTSTSDNPPTLFLKISFSLLPALLFPLMYFLQKNIALKQQKKEFEADPNFGKSHTIRLDPQNVFYQSPTGEGITKWSSLWEVTEDNHSIYLFASEKTAFLIPKRAFKTEKEAEDFYKEAFNRWQQAKA